VHQAGNEVAQWQNALNIANLFLAESHAMPTPETPIKITNPRVEFAKS
jgi:hypothetical protein